jgi:hypothetical protein
MTKTTLGSIEFDQEREGEMIVKLRKDGNEPHTFRVRPGDDIGEAIKKHSDRIEAMGFAPAGSEAMSSLEAVASVVWTDRAIKARQDTDRAAAEEEAKREAEQQSRDLKAKAEAERIAKQEAERFDKAVAAAVAKALKAEKA